MLTYRVTRTITGRLSSGDDVYDSLIRVVQQHGITLGRITGLGAVQQATFAYYDQKELQYLKLSLDEPMEILHLSRNISMRDGAPFVHAHIVLSDRTGRCVGGHLLPGSRVFACEISIDEFKGPALTREFDQQTGLALWGTKAVL